MATCKQCGNEIKYENMRVSIHGMYDMHMFTSFTGNTVDEIIWQWQQHNKKSPDTKKYGPVSLCPAIVLGYNPITGKEVEIRRVGKMVFPDRKDTEKEVAMYRQALLDDPDISRILAQHAKKTVEAFPELAALLEKMQELQQQVESLKKQVQFYAKIALGEEPER